jgi:hypothetical protein
MLLGSPRPDKNSVLLKCVCLALVLLLTTPPDALAYVDPGTGSYVFQLAIAGGLAALYTIRSYWRSLTSALRAALGNAKDRQSDSPHGVE